MGRSKVWLEHYPPEIPATISYDISTLQDFLSANAKRYPKKKALHFMGKELSYEETEAEAKKMASFLQSIGVQKGDRVAIMLPNCPQSVIGYYGALMAGAVVVQTNPLYKDRELEYQMKDSGASVIICLDILLPLVTKVRGSTDIKHTIVASVKDFLPFPKNVIYPFVQKREYKMIVNLEESEDIHEWSRVMGTDRPDYEPVDIDPMEDAALLQYTGGTTGYPKGVILTHYNLVSNVQMCRAWLHETEMGKETVLGVLPFFHVYGMTTVMNLSIMIGAKMVLLPNFQPKEVLETIEKQRPTLFPGAPTMYIGLINHPQLRKYDLSSIEACISGSAPLPAEVQDEFEHVTGGRLVEGYGLTETSPVTHANFIYKERVNGSIGVPWPDTDSKVMDMETYEEAATGQVGELAVKGPQVMKGYWNNPEETANTFIDGWLLTGDLAYMDDSGYFYIADRKKDMIIASGYNIYPREVEEVLYELEGIQEAAVAGIPDPYRGETVKAFIVLKEGYSLTEADINAYCREHLSPFKAPRLYEFRDELPKTTIGKVMRRSLTQETTPNEQA